MGAKMTTKTTTSSGSVSSLDYCDKSCAICGDSQDFRALQCGHCFCIDCLVALRGLRGTTIQCPMDRSTDDNEPESLPLPENFEGKLFIPSFDEDCSNDFAELLCAQLKIRKRTIDHLRFVATTLTSVEMKFAGAKIGGSATGTVGGAMAVVGLGLSLSGVGAFVGVPLGITGAVIAGTGGIATGAAIVAESVLKKNGIDEIKRHLQEDNFRSEQIKVLLGRAAQDCHFAQMWKIDPQDAMSFVTVIPRLVKIGITTAVGVRTVLAVGAGAARAAGTVGLHVAGIVFAAAMIPIDIVQLITSSIKIHKKKPSEVIDSIFGTANNLETELKLFLLTGKYFQMIDCIDKDNNRHWVFVIISPRNLDAVMDDLRSDTPFFYEDVKRLGETIEEGEGANIPQDVIDRMDKNWYSVHREYAEATFHQDESEKFVVIEVDGPPNTVKTSLYSPSR